MKEKELQDYILICLGLGFSAKRIVQNLEKRGWSDPMIYNAFEAVQSSKKRIPLPPAPKPPASRRLMHTLFSVITSSVFICTQISILLALLIVYMSLYWGNISPDMRVGVTAVPFLILLLTANVVWSRHRTGIVLFILSLSVILFPVTVGVALLEYNLFPSLFSMPFQLSIIGLSLLYIIFLRMMYPAAIWLVFLLTDFFVFLYVFVLSFFKINILLDSLGAAFLFPVYVALIFTGIFHENKRQNLAARIYYIYSFLCLTGTLVLLSLRGQLLRPLTWEFLPLTLVREDLPALSFAVSGILLLIGGFCISLFSQKRSELQKMQEVCFGVGAFELCASIVVLSARGEAWYYFMVLFGVTVLFLLLSIWKRSYTLLMVNSFFFIIALIPLTRQYLAAVLGDRLWLVGFGAIVLLFAGILKLLSRFFFTKKIRNMTSSNGSRTVPHNRFV